MKEIQIDWKDEGKSLKGKVMIKKLSFREKNMLEEESADVKVINGQPIVKVSTSKLKEVSLHKGIVSWELADERAQVYPLNNENIGKLPAVIGEQLFSEFTEYNAQTQKKNN